MHFEPDQIYHVYNRGNDRTRIFFKKENYFYFLRKVKNEWLRYCDILCYCLMPNHFHLMLKAKQEGCQGVTIQNQFTFLQKLSVTIGKTLSSYTQAINIQNQTRGNLFQKKTKAKCLTDGVNWGSNAYLLNCFHYIHNNPLASGLVTELRHWPYSSWPDYYGFRNGSLCNREMAMRDIGLTELDFLPSQKIAIDEEIIKLIW